jgi:uncharacterized protein involved in outer membrane biogenesis
MRKIAMVLGAVIVVLVAAVLIFAATFNVNKYRPTIQAELQKRLGQGGDLGGDAPWAFSRLDFGCKI